MQNNQLSVYFKSLSVWNNKNWNKGEKQGTQKSRDIAFTTYLVIEQRFVYYHESETIIDPSILLWICKKEYMKNSFYILSIGDQELSKKWPKRGV